MYARSMDRASARLSAPDGRSFLVQGRPAPPAPPRAPISRVAGSLALRMPPPTADAARPRLPFSPASLRRNVCPHFSLSGPRGTLPVSAPHMLRAYMRSVHNVARCRLRGGVHLEPEYVGDVCISPRFNQCVFYEEGLTGD